ncbi:hypothetical protein ABPG73_011854 [Tetrahymena malaccensis]
MSKKKLWKLNMQDISNKMTLETRRDIQRLYKEGVDYKYILHQYGISKAHFYRIIKNPEPKSSQNNKGEKQNTLTSIGKPFMMNVKQMENKGLLPKASNHVKYPEYQKYLDDQMVSIQEEQNSEFQFYSDFNYAIPQANSQVKSNYEVKSFSFQQRQRFFDSQLQDDISSDLSLKNDAYKSNSQIVFILSERQLNPLPNKFQARKQMNDRDNCSLKYTDWRASIKGLSNEQKIAVRLEIIKLKQQVTIRIQIANNDQHSQNMPIIYLGNLSVKTDKKVQHFKAITIQNIRRPYFKKYKTIDFIQLGFILVTNKERGRKTIIKEEKRYDLLKQLIKENGNSFPQRKKFFVKFLKEKQDIQEIPQTTNHVNYPEYDRFRALYDQIKDQFQNQVDTNSLQIYERISKDLNKQNSDNDCDSMCLNLSIYDQSEKRDQFFND